MPRAWVSCVLLSLLVTPSLACTKHEFSHSAEGHTLLVITETNAYAQTRYESSLREVASSCLLRS